MNAQQLDLDQYQIALSKQLSAEIKGLLDQLGVTDQIEPLDLFEISADEYTLSDELSKTLVVIRPQPQILTLTIDDEECQYVLPSSDGFGAGLAYAFSIDSLEKSQAARSCDSTIDIRYSACLVVRLAAASLTPCMVLYLIRKLSRQLSR